jgi:hypothetical protein
MPEMHWSEQGRTESMNTMLHVLEATELLRVCQVRIAARLRELVRLVPDPAVLPQRTACFGLFFSSDWQGHRPASVLEYTTSETAWLLTRCLRGAERRGPEQSGASAGGRRWPITQLLARGMTADGRGGPVRRHRHHDHTAATGGARPRSVGFWNA